MQFSASQISQIVSGTVEGNSETSVSSFAKIEEAKKDQITFFANPKYEDFLYTTQASVIILNADYKLKQPLKATLIRVADAYSAFVTLLIAYKEMMVNSLKGIEQPCYISSTAYIEENVYIGAFSYIGENVKIGKNTKVYPNAFLGDNVEIGNNCIIHPGVKIYFECVLKNNIIIHSGTVIGSEGFGYIPQTDGTFKKIPQIGNVLIEDNVEIGANTTIDRATMGSTIIKSGVKLDNLIQIAHNVELGKNVVIAAQSGISGSTKLGDNVLVGGQVGLGEHLTIGAKSRIAGGSGIRRSFTNAGSNIMGDPATDYMSYMRSQAIIRKLPELEKRIALLEKTTKISEPK